MENEEIKELIDHKQTSLENMVFINHAFNPLFFNLKQTYPNLELCFRIDDTGFLPLMLEKIWYEWLHYDIELLNEYEKIIPDEGTVYIKIPDNFNKDKLAVYNVSNYVIMNDTEFEVEGKYVKFKTNQLGSYAIAELK